MASPESCAGAPQTERPGASLRLLAAGSNAKGQLATGNTEDAHSFASCTFLGAPPGSLPSGTRAIAYVACGANHTLVLLHRDAEAEAGGSTGGGGAEVWGCGGGRRGQLGPAYPADDAETAVFRPLGIQPPRTAGDHGQGEYAPRLVAAGWETSYVVFSRPGASDVLLSMGVDDFGNLGVGGTKGKGVPRTLHVVDLHALFPGLHESVGEEEEGVVRVLHLAAGPHHVVVGVELARRDGSVYSAIAGWGTARHGQLGQGTPLSGKHPPIYAVPHIIQAGRSPASVRTISLGNQHTVIHDALGHLTGLGSDRKAQTRDLASLRNVAMSACTWNGTYAAVSGDAGWEVLATGSNLRGQLGRGDFGDCAALAAVRFPFSCETHQLVKLMCGSEHVLCLVEVLSSASASTVNSGTASASDPTVPQGTSSEVWGWGWNEHGNLGLGTTEDANAPVRMWPRPTAGAGAQQGTAVDIWCGNGTSWILVKC
ncbi:RCC1/BLIP-II [Wolfiporia cocos MD-104 SS10]|uniref:RCC1/BLIP-II n=1 Tax=Wolfiporia cocos (strain MD-104) TaxID=742152 RepID=A0A2H3JEH2_WOLCO|nr:RCC1/BLIP-II [Wolfiporia cocos MD-104 SS10]